MKKITFLIEVEVPDDRPTRFMPEFVEQVLKASCRKGQGPFAAPVKIKVTLGRMAEDATSSKARSQEADRQARSRYGGKGESSVHRGS